METIDSKLENAPYPTALEGSPIQMTKVQELIAALAANQIRYCHWKSNLALSESLAGETDIDILIHRQDAASFRNILSQLGFRPAVNKDGGSFPSIEHYFALDEASGVLVHVHAYFRVISGDSLTKNYRFPIEEMLLQNTRLEGPIRVPVKSAELIVFTLRIMLKHTSWIELALLARYWGQVKKEIAWLKETGSLAETLDFLSCWLPSVDAGLFSDCVSALEAPAPVLRRVMLGLRLRRQLGIYSRYSTGRVWWTAVRKFADMFYRRLTHSHKELTPRSGGAVIAFVGSEATGKSTLLGEMQEWLGEHFAVEQIHAGKPRSTLLSLLPNLLLPALRSLFPDSRSTRLEAQFSAEDHAEKPRASFPPVFVIRSAFLAYDRRSLLLRAFRRAANGTIILCDRYPSSRAGAPDSPQLSALADSTEGPSPLRWFARLEARMYRQIPPPDLVIHLSAPLEITLTRNANRGKKEPEDYVRRRHSRTSNLQFERVTVHRINTDQPFAQTVLEVKKAIWSIL
jgi:thymidylate kinase